MGIPFPYTQGQKNQSLFNAGQIFFVGIYRGLISDLKWHNLSYCPSLKTPDLPDNKETSIIIKLFYSFNSLTVIAQLALIHGLSKVGKYQLSLISFRITNLNVWQIRGTFQF